MCLACGARSRWAADLGDGAGLPGVRRGRAGCGPTSCGSARCPTGWSGSTRRWREADLFVSIGTSGAVYPAAGFVQQAARAAARATLELNLEPSAGSDWFDEARSGPAGVLVPAWVEEVLAA